MIFYDSTQIIIFVVTYLAIYNLTSFLLFTTLLQFINTKLTTLFSLNILHQSNLFTKVLSLSLLSLAGVPPLLGFFSKIFVIILIANSHFFLLFPPFFILLFTGLYFYIQNIRFLHSTTSHTTVHLTELSFRISLVYLYFTMIVTFILIFGFIFIDDLLMIFSWSLS